MGAFAKQAFSPYTPFRFQSRVTPLLRCNASLRRSRAAYLAALRRFGPVGRGLGVETKNNWNPLQSAKVWRTFLAAEFSVQTLYSVEFFNTKPLAPGVVQAGCQSVIGKRLKQSGMEWTVSGVNDISTRRGRGICENGHFRRPGDRKFLLFPTTIFLLFNEKTYFANASGKVFLA